MKKLSETLTETPRTNRAAYYMGRTGDDKDEQRWCDLLNESRAIELELIEARAVIRILLDETATQ